MIDVHDGLFFPFELGFLEILRNLLSINGYLFVNVILQFELLDLVDLFSTDDKMIDWGVVFLLVLMDAET